MDNELKTEKTPMVDLGYYCREFSSNALVFENLLGGITAEQQQWKPNEDKWNLLEVTCHLYDEEREDFRARLALLLESPGTAFPSIDPQGWVKSRNYSGQDYEMMLMKFLKEREESLNWLRTLQNASWENAYIHPKVGPVKGRFMIANWLAHDHLHIRQVTRLKYDYLRFHSGENLDYAGNW